MSIFPSPAKQPMILRIRLSTLSLLVWVVAIHIDLYLLTARHNAQIWAMTNRCNAQLAEQTLRHNAQLAKQAEEFNVYVRNLEARYNARLAAKGAAAPPVSSVTTHGGTRAAVPRPAGW